MISATKLSSPFDIYDVIAIKISLLVIRAAIIVLIILLDDLQFLNFKTRQYIFAYQCLKMQ